MMIDPAKMIGSEALIEKLLEGVEFSTFPVELIGCALMRGKSILSAMQSGAMEEQDMPHMADAAQAQVDTALSLVLAWDKQQRKSNEVPNG